MPWKQVRPCRLLTPPPSFHPPLLPYLAAILDDQSVCGRGERLALALARENINSVMEGPARARVEVDIYELQKDSQYDTTDTSECCPHHKHDSHLLKSAVRT